MTLGGRTGDGAGAGTREGRASSVASPEGVAALFTATFAGAPAAVASAPGRVNLIGEHTDYNGGEVLPIGIAQRTIVAVGEIAGRESRTISANEPIEGRFSSMRPERSGAWWDYIAGSVAEFGAATAPVTHAIGVAVASDVPVGSGLSSSAALEVATAVALGAMRRSDLPLERVARIAHRAETAFVGVECGIMDQYASALARQGHALHLWCDTASFEQVPVRDAVLVFDTGVPRSLRTSAFNERQAECADALARLRVLEPALPNLASASLDLVQAAALPDPLSRRARHVVTEMARVHTAVDALLGGGSIDGDTLLASHASLRDDYECSSPELDWFVARVMREPGVRGARLTGAGWGGCAIALGDAEPLAAAAVGVARDYAARFGHPPRYWVTRASPGATVEPAT